MEDEWSENRASISEGIKKGTRRLPRLSLGALDSSLSPIPNVKETNSEYLCFGYYDKAKIDGMSEAERNAMFDTCFEYDDHLRAGGHWVG